MVKEDLLAKAEAEVAEVDSVEAVPEEAEVEVQEDQVAEGDPETTRTGCP